MPSRPGRGSKVLIGISSWTEPTLVKQGNFYPKNVYREKLPAEVVDEVWSRFREALMPLHSAGKLGAVLFQFPQWFVIGRASKDYIVECKERLPDYMMAVELRHKSWIRGPNKE